MFSLTNLPTSKGLSKKWTASAPRRRTLRTFTAHKLQFAVDFEIPSDKEERVSSISPVKSKKRNTCIIAISRWKDDNQEFIKKEDQNVELNHDINTPPTEPP